MTDKEDKQSINTPIEYSEEHFRIVQKLTHLGSWRMDLNSNKVHASAEACRIYGIEYQDYSLEYIQSLALSEYRSVLDAELGSLIANGSGYDVEFQLKRVSDGAIRDIRSIAEYNAEKHIVTGAIHDVTEHKSAERAHQESEERFRRLFDNSVSGIIYTDIEGHILEVNSKMLQLLDSPSMKDTKNVNVLTFPRLVDAGFSADFKKVIDTSSVVNGAAMYHSKWGADRYLEYVLNPVKRNGKIVSIIGKVEDITERKQTEEKVQSLLDEKDVLLREIHHRLKNNMASIESLLKIQLGASNDQRVTAPLLDAVARLGSMRVLYDKLYLSADFIHTSIEDYLSTLIDEIFEVFPDGRSIRVVKNIQNFLIPSDKIFPLGLMINELLTNAFKYAFTDSDSEKQIRISVSRIIGGVRIVVRDNGGGYPENREEAEGSGFGLQLVHMLAQQIGGNADFRNENGAVCEIEFGID